MATKTFIFEPFVQLFYIKDYFMTHCDQPTLQVPAAQKQKPY